MYRIKTDVIHVDSIYVDAVAVSGAIVGGGKGIDVDPTKYIAYRLTEGGGYRLTEDGGYRLLETLTAIKG